MHENADGSLVSYFHKNLVLEDALGHEQEQNFIRGRENLTRGGKLGWRGREVGGEGEGSGKWVPPCPPPQCGSTNVVFSATAACGFSVLVQRISWEISMLCEILLHCGRR